MAQPKFMTSYLIFGLYHSEAFTIPEKNKNKVKKLNKTKQD